MKEIVSDNDYQPHISEADIEKDSDVTQDLMWHQVLCRRNQKLVLRYYKSNKHLYVEKFAYHLLLPFYPFVNEIDLFSKDWTYSGKLQEPIVCATVSENKQIFEPNSQLVDTLWKVARVLI